MKKFLVLLLFIVTFFTVEAAAVTNDVVKVGLKFDKDTMFSANLENEVGSGYSVGYYDEARNFVRLGDISKRKISMTAAGTVYLNSDGTYASSSRSPAAVIGGWHIQTPATFDSFESASAIASAVGGYPAYINDEFRVRIGCYKDESAAKAAMLASGISGSVVSSSRTGILVTATRSADVLFEFDCQGLRNLGIFPNGGGEKPVTWFKGYKYYGGFEYYRITGGNLTVVNVLNVEDYVKGVIPYEMNPTWPLAALEAQAVCARTYAHGNIGHLRTYGFDVCCTSDCQVYYGLGNGSRGPSYTSNQAVENTAGLCLYYDGEYINAVYHSSNGGATESSENIWGGARPYLQAKEDPYESTITIPNYEYTVSYTPAELTWVAHNSGYSEMIGDICDVYISGYTEMGNVHKVTLVDTEGKQLVLTGHKARTLFYSTTYDKNVRSQRFRMLDTAPASLYINSVNNSFTSVGGMAVISGDGTIAVYEQENPYVITGSGIETLVPAIPKAPDQFVITGVGNGHNVGMSQYGAKAMATLGMSFYDILTFYYTDITIE